MKIFYAIQATGNGHIARAKELIPYLQKYGQVDTFLSGDNSHLQPGFDITYRSKGLSFLYNAEGGIDYKKTIRQMQFKRAWKEALDLPIHKYDIIINDFESITSLASKMKNKTSIGVGHQYSFLSRKVPKPKFKSFMGEMVLQHFAPTNQRIGLHFLAYDNFILPPVIKEQIKMAKISNMGHITVYLSQYSALAIREALSKCPQYQFQVFTQFVTQEITEGNITYLPIDNKRFAKSMCAASGIITGGGFETPAEALYMQKPLIVIPIQGQYEQKCNTEAIKQIGGRSMNSIKEINSEMLTDWLHQCRYKETFNAISNQFLTEKIIQMAFSGEVKPNNLIQRGFSTFMKNKLSWE